MERGKRAPVSFGAKSQTLRKAVDLPQRGRAKAMSAKATAARERLDNLYIVTANSPEDLQAAWEALLASPDVLHVEPDFPIYLQAAPTDPMYPVTWSMQNTGQSYPTGSGGTASGTAGADINWRPAWDAGLPTGAVIVAVLDTGVDYNHEDMAANMWINTGEIPGNGIDDDLNGFVDDIYGWNTIGASANPIDDHSHGTHVAGTIAAVNNTLGIAGINPRAKIMAVKIFDAQARSTLSAALQGITYAVENGANIINNSWGGYTYSQFLADAILYASEQGVIVVCAAGNANTSQRMYPASYPGAISIAATDSKDDRAPFSNYGSSIDLAAPGVDILSLKTSLKGPASGDYSNKYLVASGTSMASPTAAGAFSLLYAKYPGRDPWIYQRVMQFTANTNIYSRPANSNYIGQLGRGRVDVHAALNYTATSLFVTARTPAIGGASFRPRPGDTNVMTVRVGTWLHGVSNASVRATILSSGITLNTTNLSLGNISADTIIISSNDFRVVVTTNAVPGSLQGIRFDAYSGAALTDSFTLQFVTYKGSVNNFIPTDVFPDGRRRIVAWNSGAISLQDINGEILWSVAVSGSLTYLYGATLGDFTGDSREEILYWYGSTFGGSAFYSMLDMDGNTISGWPIGAGFRPGQAIAHDLTGNGKHKIITANYQVSASNLTLRARQGDGTVIWSNQITAGDMFANGIALGDVTGNGSPDLVAVSLLEDRIYILNATNGAITRSFDAPGYSFRESVRLADLDGDGADEIVVTGYDKITSAAFVFVFQGDGQPRPGWPQYARPNFETWGTADVQFGDLNGDGMLELVLVDAINARLAGWNSYGAPLLNFPLADTNLYGRVAISDVNGDGQADLVYVSNYRKASTNEVAYDIVARDATGMMLHGYPITLREVGDLSPDTDNARIALSTMVFDNYQTNVFILSCVFGTSLAIHDTGYAFAPESHHWPSLRADRHMTGRYQRPPGGFHAGFMTLNGDAAVGNFPAILRAHVSGSTNGVGYHWDFTNDGSIDLSGANRRTVTNTYTAPGVYTVRLVVTNAAGESYTAVRTNYIRTLSALTADFTANIRTAVAPVEISFTDLSGPEPHAWRWSFGNGATSTVQNPKQLYTNTGLYTVTLTVTNSFPNGSKSSNRVTKTSYINITGVMTVTNHYVSKTGAHIYPFKTWAEAATNVADAVSAAIPGSTVHVGPGVWRSGRVITIETGVVVRSTNGRGATILDGGGIDRVIMMSQLSRVEGFTIQNGFSHDGSGVFMRGGQLIDCIVARNIGRADLLGSTAAVVLNISLTSYTNAVIRNCIIENNTSTSISALYLAGNGVNGEEFPHALVENCIIRNNEGSSTAATGNRNTVIRNTLFAGNTNTSTRLLSTTYFTGHQVRIENCTFVNNTVAAGANSSVIRFSADLDSMINTLIFSNNVRGISLDPEVATGSVTLVNNIIQNPPAGLPGIGTITNAPVFVNFAGGDYRLAGGSPGVNAGMNYTYNTYSTAGEILVDLGSSSFQMGSGWNNVTTLGAGQKVANLVYSNGANSGYSLHFLTAFTGVDTTGTASSPYPFTAMRDSLEVTNLINQTPLLVISNLPSNRMFDYRHIASTVGGANPWTRYWINGGQSSVYLADQTTSAWIRLKVTPTNGAIQIDAQNTAVNYRGALGVIHLTDYLITPVNPQSNKTDLAGSPRLHGGVIDIGAYETGTNYHPTVSLSTTSVFPRVGDIVTFIATAADPDGSITNYLWTFSDGFTTNGPALASVARAFTSAAPHGAAVRVFDNVGATADVDISIIVIEAAPLAPFNLVVTNNPSNPYTALDLTWSSGSNDEQGFIIQRKRIEGTPVDIIIDNSDPRVTHSVWFTNATAAAGYYGTNYLRSNVTGSDRHAFFTPFVEEAGWYDISAWWPAASNHAFSVSIRIAHAFGRQTFTVDQRIDGSQWNMLGTYYLEPGYASEVRITHHAVSGPRFTVADAMRFTKSGFYETIGFTAAGVTNFTDTGLLNDVVYGYRVAASNAMGISPWSAEASGITINTNPYPEVAITSVNPNLGRADLNVSASGIATDDNGIANFIWNFGDGFTGSLQFGANLTNASYVYRYPGTYTISLTAVDETGKQTTTSTNVVVYDATEMAVSPASFTFDWQQGELPPAPGSLSVSNVLIGALRYSISSDAAWLAASPTGGALAAGSGNLHNIVIITNGLGVGTWNASLTVASGDASNSPMVIPVTLNVSHPTIYPPATGETAVLRFDFGPADGITTGFWNNIADTSSGLATNIIDTAGYTHQGLSLAVTAPFVSAIQSGATSTDPALGWPATATRDAFMGSLAEGLLIRWGGDYLVGTTARGFVSGFGADTLDENIIRAPDNANYNRSFTGGVFYANLKRLTDNGINLSQVEDGSGTNTLSVQLFRQNTTGNILGHGVFMWKQTNFVSGFNNVSAAPTEFSITAIRNQHGGGSNQVRWLVKEGEQYYVSQNAHSFVSHIPSNRTDTIGSITGWQAYDPTTDLEFTPGSFTSRTFSNVTAVGYYVRMFRADAPVNGILRMDVSEFAVRGQVAGQSGDPASVTLSGLNPNLAYALRFFASSTGETANLDTEYRVTHASGVSAVRLNPANNTGTVAQTAALYPALDGTLSVQVRTGDDNNDPTGRYLLGAMEAEFVNDPLSTPPFDGGSYYNWTNATGRKVRFWIPNNLGIARGILLVGNPAGGDAVGEANHASKQLFAQRHGFIILATGFFFRFADTVEGTNDWNALMDAFNYIVTETGRQEITNAPIVSYGYSNGGQMSYNLMRLLPDRTIAFCVNKGGFYNYDTSPRPHIPGIFIAGQTDTDSRKQAISNLFVNGRSEGAPWAWLEEHGEGHVHANSEALLFAFYDEAIAQRYPPHLAPTATTAPTLLPVVETNGWLVSIQPTNWASGYAAITPSAGYVGNKNAWGWVPSERIAHLFRAVASYDPGVSSGFTVTRKPVLTQSPLFGSYANTAVIFYPGHNLDMTVQIDPALTDWQEVAFYDGELLLTTVTNAGTNIVFTYLTLDPSRIINSVHARLKRADNSFRSSSVNQLMASDYFAPAPPINLISNTATNGVPTNVRDHAFSWARPANMASVPGYAFSLAGEPERASPINVTNTAYTNLAPGTHTFRVRAQSSLGYWGPSATFNLIIEGGFADPTNLTAQAINATRIDLAWVDLAESETGYVVQRRLVADVDPILIDNADTGRTSRVGAWTATGEPPPALLWNFVAATNGAALNTVPNLGPQTVANWNINVSGSAVTNGAYRIRANTAVDTYAGNGVLNYTTDVHVLEVDLAGWNVVGAVNDQWLQLSFNNGVNSEISAGLVLQQTPAGLVFYGRALGTGGTDIGTTNAPVKTYGLTMTNTVSLRLVADFSGNTYQVFFRDQDTTNHYVLGGSGSIASTRKGRAIRLRPSGDWSGAGEFIDISRIAVARPISAFYETDYEHDGATAKGQRSFTFNPGITVEGAYNVEMRHPSGPWHATNAPVVIQHADGVQTVLVNQAVDGNTWITLGTFNLDPSSQIDIRTTNTTGYVVADAVRLTYQAAAWETIATLPANSASYSDLTVAPETTYEYRVRATNATEQSAWISAGPVTTPADNNPDTDGDGIPDDWETTYFGGPTNANASALAANGVNTIMESFIAGLNPNNPDSVFEVHGSTQASGNQSVLTWTPSVTGRVYAISWTTNLHNQFTPLVTNLPGPQTTYTTTVHTLHPSTYFRIEVRMVE